MEKVEDIITTEISKITKPLQAQTDRKLQELEKANDFSNLDAILENAQSDHMDDNLEDMLNGNSNSPDDKKTKIES